MDINMCTYFLGVRNALELSKTIGPLVLILTMRIPSLSSYIYTTSTLK